MRDNNLLWFCGLYDPNRPDYSSKNSDYGTQIPVTSLACNVSVRNLVADVEMKLKFENTTSNPVEAIFYFRHYEVAMYHFDVKIRGKTVVGKVHEKEKAANIYDDAIASGHGSYMVEKSDTSDMFKMSLGNLPPKESCTITIRYVTKLRLMKNTYLFAFPIPAVMQARMQDDVDITVDISVEMNSPILELTSDSHDIKVTTENSKTKVHYNSNEVSKESSEFMMKVVLEDPFVPSGYLLPSSSRNVQKPSDMKPASEAEQFTDSHILALNLCPKLEMSEDDIDHADASDLEILFLLDRSGSMSGSRIEQAKNALQIYMRSLLPGCYFNIYSFGSSYQSWRTAPVVYDQTTLDEASEYIKGLGANMGGTDILNPLSYMLSQSSTRVRNIILITDGEVNNTAEILNMVKAKSKDSRLFTLGIGEASRFLLEGIAKYGRGIAEFVNSGERVEAKVLNTLRYVVAPTMRHVKIDWGNLPVVKQAPQEISSLFVGEHAVVYAFVDKKFKGELLEQNPVEVTVSGKIGKKIQESKVKFSQIVQDRLTEVSAVHKLIQDLEKDSKNAPVATYLSVVYNLVSKNTSMVAVEERDESVSDAPLQVHYVNGKEADTAPTPPQQSYAPPAPRFSGASSNAYSPRASGNADKIAEIQRQVDEVRSVMSQNIDRVLERAESIEDLVDRTDSLATQGMVLKASARNLRSRSLLGGISNVFSSIGSSISNAFSAMTAPSTTNTNNNNSNTSPVAESEKAVEAYSKTLATTEINSPTKEETKSKAPKTLPSGSHIRPIDKIIYLQCFNGSWDLELTLLDLLQVPLSKLESTFDSSLMSKEEFKTLLATVLAVVYISTKFPELQAEWQMVVQKASRFIKKACDETKQDETALTNSVSQLLSV